MAERTFLMLKPDAIQRGLMGEILGRIEAKGYKPVAMKFMRLPKELAERHYAEHKGKPFFPGLIEYITSGPSWSWYGRVRTSSPAWGPSWKTNPSDAALAPYVGIWRSRPDAT